MSESRHPHTEALLERLNGALENVYHNATLPFFDVDRFADDFDAWMADMVSDAFADINNYDKWNGRYPRFYLGGDMKKKRVSRLPYPDRLYGINSYGKIYQYGRGGRTVAPEQLMTRRDNIKRVDEFFDMSRAALTELVLLIEAFNAHVRDFCFGIPADWASYVEDRTTEAADHLETAAVD